MDNVTITFSSSEGPAWMDRGVSVRRYDELRTDLDSDKSNSSMHTPISFSFSSFSSQLILLSVSPTMLSKGNKKGFEVSYIVSIDRLGLMVQV